MFHGADMLVCLLGKSVCVCVCLGMSYILRFFGFICVCWHDHQTVFVSEQLASRAAQYN